MWRESLYLSDRRALYKGNAPDCAREQHPPRSCRPRGPHGPPEPHVPRVPRGPRGPRAPHSHRV